MPLGRETELVNAAFPTLRELRIVTSIAGKRSFKMETGQWPVWWDSQARRIR